MNIRAMATLLLLLAGLTACGADTTPDVGAYLGRWYFVDSSGGIAGSGDRNYPADEVELTRDHFNKFKDGNQIGSEAVDYQERDCITGERHVAMCSAGSCYCLTIVDADLYASQDAADGFGYHFSRVRPNP